MFPGASHCSDFRSAREDDPKNVKTARTEVINLIDKWLKDDN